MNGYFGWQGKILIADLSKKSFNERMLSKEEMEGYLGGGGINTKLLYEFTPPHTDPLSEESALIIGAGPLVGTQMPASGRFTITFKSPLTGIFADSNAGGNFGVVLKKTGYDHIVIKGISSEPVYLYISDEKVEIIQANDLWGLDTFETNNELIKRYGNEIETARIGQAGENLVKYASIVTSTKRLGVFGRCGVGALMGSKRLKAIVVKGKKEIKVADTSSVGIISEHLNSRMAESFICKDRSQNGTLNVITGYIATNELWKENHRAVASEEEGMMLDPSEFHSKYYNGKSGCYRCPLACSLKWKIPEGKFAGEEGGKIEFGHTFPLGVNIGLFDFPSVFHLTNLTNRYGIDSVELGYVLSMASECYEKGIINDKMTENTRIQWGDVDSYQEIIEKIVFRRNIGDILAEGTKKAADIIGGDAPRYALNIKGLGYGPESSNGWTLGLLTSTRGGDHLKAMPISLFAYGVPHFMDAIMGKKAEDPNAYIMNSPACKGRYIWWHENYKAVIDSLGLCIFPYIMLAMGSAECLIDELNVLFTSSTGITLSDDDFMKAAERTCQLQKLYNYELGLSRADDELKARPVDDCWKETSPFLNTDTSHKGMLDEYYIYRGYSQDGKPTAKKLIEVGLEEYIHRLDRKGI